MVFLSGGMPLPSASKVATEGPTSTRRVPSAWIRTSDYVTMAARFTVRLAKELQLLVLRRGPCWFAVEIHYMLSAPSDLQVLPSFANLRARSAAEIQANHD